MANGVKRLGEESGRAMDSDVGDARPDDEKDIGDDGRDGAALPVEPQP